jgi:hypothetical protein
MPDQELSNRQQPDIALSFVREYFRGVMEGYEEVEIEDWDEHLKLALEIAGKFPQHLVSVLSILRVPVELRAGLSAAKILEMWQRLDAAEVPPETVLLALGSQLSDLEDEYRVEDLSDDIEYGQRRLLEARFGDEDEGVPND